jgi:hypothetical protein
MTGWRPIETAPKKGGFRALIYCSDFPRIYLGEYRGGGWSVDVDGHPCDPTHWMPLPEPPKG